MTTATPLYGTTTAMTITLASLASDTNLVAGRQSTVAANGTDDAIDALVGGKVTTGTTPTASKQIEVWLFGSYDDTEYSAGAGASDANLTPDTKTLLKLLTIIPTVNTSDKAYRWGPFSVAQAFGGVMPENWGVYIVHNTGVNLNATGGNHEVHYTPVKYESA
jgi:hypothetical protein